MKTFVDEFEKLKSVAFGNITVVNLEKRAENREAEVLPSGEMIRSLTNKCTKVFNKIGQRKTIVEASFFIEVRRAAYCRLLFFNGRRSKEISCLSIKQWHLAKKNYYLTPQQNKFLENTKSCFLL